MTTESNRSKQRQRRSPVRRPRVSVTLDEETIDRIEKAAGKISHSAFAAEALDFFLNHCEETKGTYSAKASRRS